MKKEKIYRVFSHLPELITDRLTLRRILVTDYRDMYEYSKNSEVTVLFESFDGEYVLGHTPNFIEVKAKHSCSLSGKLINIKLTHTDGEYLYGEI